MKHHETQTTYYMSNKHLDILYLFNQITTSSTSRTSSKKKRQLRIPDPNRKPGNLGGATSTSSDLMSPKNTGETACETDGILASISDQMPLGFC